MEKGLIEPFSLRSGKKSEVFAKELSLLVSESEFETVNKIQEFRVDGVSFTSSINELEGIFARVIVSISGEDPFLRPAFDSVKRSSEQGNGLTKGSSNLPETVMLILNAECISKMSNKIELEALKKGTGLTNVSELDDSIRVAAGTIVLHLLIDMLAFAGIELKQVLNRVVEANGSKMSFKSYGNGAEELDEQGTPMGYKKGIKLSQIGVRANGSNSIDRDSTLSNMIINRCTRQVPMYVSSESLLKLASKQNGGIAAAFETSGDPESDPTKFCVSGLPYLVFDGDLESAVSGFEYMMKSNMIMKASDDYDMLISIPQLWNAKQHWGEISDAWKMMAWTDVIQEKDWQMELSRRPGSAKKATLIPMPLLVHRLSRSNELIVLKIQGRRMIECSDSTESLPPSARRFWQIITSTN